ncbi:hypothetical protein [Methylobacillus flagellatus]|uniref:SMODS and SLOG-associating 2TM effector domain-containing protein n=1 Tax=Methylobacillus flagellatus (strain ATCC 51484 / DSM 6875 / VKM B-1610 / KT) TaxID=265072 RepID=Q1GXR6_METFK|nr:hypothetical protein [Methylobacillus flagellatus]ABE50971.1 conserved hypothetical protein [Methylobacillus flagellatus KT]
MINTEKLSSEQWGLLFDVRRSIRYHDKRRSFFLRLHQFTSVLTIMMAGSVVFDFAKPGEVSWWLKVISLGTALLVIFDLAFRFSEKEKIHLDLKGRWIDLESKMLSKLDDESAWNEFCLDRLKIEQDEPPIYRALDLLCHNELTFAEGLSQSERFDIPCHYLLFKNISHFHDICNKVKKFPKEEDQ